AFEGEVGATNDVPDDGDDDVGRQVVGAMVRQVLAACLAIGPHLEEAREQPATAAGRAAAGEAAPHRAPPVARRLESIRQSSREGHVVSCFARVLRAPFCRAALRAAARSAALALLAGRKDLALRPRAR